MSGEVETSQAEPDLTALEGFLVGNQDLERLAINSAPIPYRSLGIALRFTSKSCKRRADERTRTADLLIRSVRSVVAKGCRGVQIPHK
jgi:hypothetical protein